MELLFSVFAVISLAAILLLGIEIGLLSKFFGFELKKHIMIVLAYSIIIFAIILLLSPFYERILSSTFFSFYYYIIMGIICLILGLVTLFYWKKMEWYPPALKCLLYFDFIPISLSLLLISTSLMAPSFLFRAQNLSLTLTMINSGAILVVLLALVMIIFYVFSDFVDDYRTTEYAIIFGSMLLIFAFAYFILGFIIPNMAPVFANPSTELTLMPIESMAVIVILLAVFLGLGYLFKKRHNRLE